MRWIDTEPDIKAIPVSDVINEVNAIDLISLIANEISVPYIIITKEVQVQIIEHITTGNTELGGLLLGNVISYDNLKNGIVAISIAEAIPSEQFESSPVSLEMDSSIWTKANKKTRSDFFVVGWYHSHPNLGAFFSGTDRRTQKNFFNQQYHVGLVVDHIRKESKFFLGMESFEVPPSKIISSKTDLFSSQM